MGCMSNDRGDLEMGLSKDGEKGDEAEQSPSQPEQLARWLSRG